MSFRRPQVAFTVFAVSIFWVAVLLAMFDVKSIRCEGTECLRTRYTFFGATEERAPLADLPRVPMPPSARAAVESHGSAWWMTGEVPGAIALAALLLLLRSMLAALVGRRVRVDGDVVTVERFELVRRVVELRGTRTTARVYVQRRRPSRGRRRAPRYELYLELDGQVARLYGAWAQGERRVNRDEAALYTLLRIPRR